MLGARVHSGVPATFVGKSIGYSEAAGPHSFTGFLSGKPVLRSPHARYPERKKRSSADERRDGSGQFSDAQEDRSRCKGHADPAARPRFVQTEVEQMAFGARGPARWRPAETETGIGAAPDDDNCSDNRMNATRLVIADPRARESSSHHPSRGRQVRFVKFLCVGMSSTPRVVATGPPSPPPQRRRGTGVERLALAEGPPDPPADRVERLPREMQGEP